MAVHHSLASLTTFAVVFVCAVGALPLGWYGSSYYHPMTTLGAPYLGQFNYFHRYPLPSPVFNPYQRLLDLLRPDGNSYLPEMPSSLTDKNTNWVLTIMKWPGWDTVITDDKARKKWKKLIGNLSNYTDINNPQWSKQLRTWIEKQPDIVTLFTKVSNFMAKSPQWEKNIKVWLNFTSISADYVNSFKQWLKRLISESKPTTPGPFPDPIPPFPSFPTPPWQRPMFPWMPPKNVLPDFGKGWPMDPENPEDSEIDPGDRGMIPQIPGGMDQQGQGMGQDGQDMDQQGPGMIDPGMFQPGQPPYGPMGIPPFFYPQQCTGYDGCSSPSNPPSMPDFQQPPNPNFPQYPTPDFQQPSTPDFQQPSTPDFQQPPMPNFPQPPMPNFPQPPMPNFPQSPMPNFPQSPMENFPQFPSEFPQVQSPEGPMMPNPFPGGPGFNDNSFSDGGLGPELPDFNNIRQRDTDTASCPQCEEISIILDLRNSNLTFCKMALTAPRQSLKNFFILASFENKCFNLTTKVRNSRLWGQTGEYIFSLNGLPETIFHYWIAYLVNGTQDTELNYQPQNGDHIIVDYTNWKTIVNKIATTPK